MTSLAKNQKINLLKKYWKETLLLFFLATFSTLGFLLLWKNGATGIYNLLKGGKDKSQIEYAFFFFGEKKLFSFGSEWRTYLSFMAFFISLWCFGLLIPCYYYRSRFANLIIGDLKKQVSQKLFRLAQEPNKQEKEEILNLIYYQIRIFGDFAVYAPDQFYVFFLSVIIVFYETQNAASQALGWGFGYLILTGLFTLGLNYWLYRKDLEFQKALEKQTQKENVLVNHRQLIIKKGLANSHLTKYFQTIQFTQKKANEESWADTLCKTIPSYFWIELMGYFLLGFLVADDSNSFTALMMLNRLSVSFKRLINGLNNYPAYFSAKKKINNFLKQIERNDRQKNIFIQESIETLTGENLTFAYENNQFILNNLNFQFCRGKINRLAGANGTGKSTIINLIMGLNQPQKGEIIVNNHYQLRDLNLAAWRNKIAYAEHQNLVENNLSTGQKQLKDLAETLNQKGKEIFIFDEADSSLDERKKKEFIHRLEELSKNKLVIVISHS